MTKLSNSPQRNSFQRGKYLERKELEEKTPDNDDTVAAMLDYYSSWDARKAELEADPAWAENNMEYDLRTTDWILEKVRSSDSYAQNLYAAMCNNDFQKNDFLPRLKGQTWSCSWRYAGGIIADMREKGDYIDWYCTGIRDVGYEVDDEQFRQMSKEEQESYIVTKNYVSESVVTDEIQADLKRLGWFVVDDPNHKNTTF